VTRVTLTASRVCHYSVNHCSGEARGVAGRTGRHFLGAATGENCIFKNHVKIQI